jgi:Ca2+-transporting ATPase
VLADMQHAAAIAAGEYSAETLGSSMAFLTLSMAEIFHSLNMRSLHGSIFKLKNQNLWLWGAAALSLVLTTVVIEIPPLAKAFDLARLDLPEYAIALGLAVLIIPMVEVGKIFTRMSDRKREQQEQRKQ